MPEPKIKQLALKNIIVDPALRMRAKGLNERLVGEYAESMKAGVEFEPAVVYHDQTGTNWLSRGFHRYAAALKAGHKTLTVEMRHGTRLEALIDAAGSNGDHGLRRTNADKRLAVEQLLTALPEWTNSQIAQAVGVSESFTGDVKKRLQRIKDGLPVKLIGSGLSDDGKPKSDEGEEEEPAGEVEVTSASAEKCLTVVASIVKLLHRSQEKISALMSSPHAAILRNSSQSLTKWCALYATGETVKMGEIHGVHSFGYPQWSTEALDEMLKLCGQMKQALERADEIKDETPAPWTMQDVADLGASLRNPDDTVEI